MSGGSFDYIYLKWGEELFEGGYIDSLESMVRALEQIPGAEDASSEALELLLSIKAAKVRADSMANRLSQVFREVERYYSGDGNEKNVQFALFEYRSCSCGRTDTAIMGDIQVALKLFRDGAIDQKELETVLHLCQERLDRLVASRTQTESEESNE
jgi:hypothetical protein